jgi:lipoprotein-releasing system permease protein
MKTYESFVGFRYLRAKPAQTVMSLGGVVLGIVVVIVSLSIFSGFQQTLRDKLLGAEAHLIVLPQAADLTDYKKVVTEFESLPKVVAASPSILGQALLRNYADKDRLSGAMVKGLDPETAPRVGDVDAYLRSGHLNFDRPELIEMARRRGVPEDDTIQGGIVLGWALARRLRVQVGDPIFVFADFKEDPFGKIYPVPRIFVVCDLYNSGLYEIDANMAFVSLAAAQSLYRTPTGVTQIEIRAQTPDDADAVQREILVRYGLEYAPKTWKELRGSFFSAMELEKRLTFVILALIVVVAAFSIAITLIMLVMEKYREIGTLKALGATRGGILRLFMLNGTIVGVIGAGAGTAISLILCYILKHYLRIPLPGDVYQIDYVPVKVSWGYVGLVNALSVLICWLATLYPAFRASRLNPVEALRYE